jgi:hypothetical protein
MKTKPLYMETTVISPDRTAGEITSLLVASGARSIAMDYGERGKIIGMHFVLMVRGVPHPFKMPIRTEPVFQILNGRRKSWDRSASAEKDREQAERVAWRQLLRWVQVQMAMVDCGMAQAREVFAPYLLHPTGMTLFEYLEETRFKALPPPEAKEA